MKKITTLAILAFFATACQSTGPTDNEESKVETSAEESPAADPNAQPTAAEGARVFFANLADGDTVSSPLLVEFGIEGMEVEPAGTVNSGKGHHHIIINNSYIEFGGTVPADSVNIHYGGGQTSDSLDLNPGNYKLTMQFADGFHRSYGEQLAATISIVVE